MSRRNGRWSCCGENFRKSIQKTEQYVDMAAQYLRLDSASSDFVFKEYSLDDILKQALREYSGMFIRKRIALNYRQTGITVVTDENGSSLSSVRSSPMR